MLVLIDSLYINRHWGLIKSTINITGAVLHAGEPAVTKTHGQAPSTMQIHCSRETDDR